MTKFIPDNPTATYKLQFLPRLDAAAATGIAAVEAAGGTLSATAKAACNTLIVGMKAQGIWTNTPLLYLLVGGTSGAHAVNWRTPGTFNMTWTNSPTHSASGVAYSGTAHGRTGFVPGSQSVDSSSVVMFGYVNSMGSGNRPIIAAQSDASTCELILMHNASNENQFASGAYAGRAGTHGAVKTTSGLFAAQRRSTTVIDWYNDGAKTTVTTSSSGTGAVPLALFTGCYNYEGSAALFANNRVALLGFAKGFWSDAQHTAFASLVAAFQTALSRA